MASKILAAAVRKMIDAGASTDWVFGGDFNAPLATDDFAALVGGDMVPLGAQDEAGGAFSYVKGPRSLIDHIFLSPNLAARFGASDYFIVATEKDFPRFVREISGHRPVLARLSLVTPALGGAGVTPPTTAALDELNQILCRGWAKEPTGDGFERTRASEPAASYAEREGYVDTFLGDAATLVPLPALSDKQSTDAAVVDPRAAGVGRFVLRYTHFSVVMNGRRRLPFYTATNIDGTDLRRIPRESDAWAYDPRIRRDEQVGDELYAGTDLDRGHMTRRLDPVWGKRATADLADLDTFHFTNCCPQHRDLNRREWLRLEDYVLGHSETDGLKVSVFTGPIFGARDREFRAVRIPEAYWKVVVMRRKDTQRLSATAYVLGQKDMIGGLETFAFGAFKTYQVTVRDVERRTGLGFGSLRDADPMSRARPESSGGFESAAGAAKLIEGPGDVMI
jgi:endonuclease G